MGLSSMFILLISALCVRSYIRSYEEDYCWRDYDGVIPPDALAHGVNSHGKMVFAGQVLFGNYLIPGQIYEGDNRIYFEWNGDEQSTNKNVKILCSKNPDNFVWVKTKNTEVPHLSEDVLMKGGYEPGYTTYIGRIVENHITYVGKVICQQDRCLGLYVSKNGRTQMYQEFEVMAYRPSSNN